MARPPTFEEAERLFEVRGDHVVWHKADYRPGFSLTAKPAAFSVMAQERHKLIEWGQRAPDLLEKRMERMVMVDPGVAYAVATELVRVGVIREA